MQSIGNRIVSYIKKCGRGKVIFVSDFVRYGESRAVNKALERLVLSEVIIRVAKGIYYYPKIDKKLCLGVLYPSLETIAEAIAHRYRSKRDYSEKSNRGADCAHKTVIAECVEGERNERLVTYACVDQNDNTKLL